MSPIARSTVALIVVLLHHGNGLLSAHMVPEGDRGIGGKGDSRKDERSRSRVDPGTGHSLSTIPLSPLPPYPPRIVNQPTSALLIVYEKEIVAERLLGRLRFDERAHPAIRQ